MGVGPNGGIGIRVRLKIEWSNPYGFESHFGHQGRDEMNILYCGDKGIMRGVLVSILSLMEWNREPLRIYIMTVAYGKTVALPAAATEFLDGLVKEQNRKSFVRRIDATEAFERELPKKNMRSYFTPCSMLRLYADRMPELEGLERILYLDYDVVCRGAHSDYHPMALPGVEAAGVLDLYGSWVYHYHGLFRRDYMNSGVMLLNMEEVHRGGMLRRAVKMCGERWMMLADQAALNKAIRARRLVDRKYNEQGQRPRPDTVLHHFSNNFRLWPVLHVQKVKSFETEKIHRVLKITEYDELLAKYERVWRQMERAGATGETVGVVGARRSGAAGAKRAGAEKGQNRRKPLA